MPIRVHQIILPHDHADGAAEDAALAAVGLRPDQVRAVRVRRRSIDARRSDDVRLVYQVDIRLDQGGEGECAIARGARSGNVTYVADQKRDLEPGSEPLAGLVVVVGAGPCGLFAAYRLAQYGYRPLVLERGKSAQERLKDLRAFRLSGRLDPESNLLFGEGGAGMYSDGKLTTRVRSPFLDEILETFHAGGAPESILTEARPHIGSNLLPRVLRNLSARISGMGAAFRFGTRVRELEIVGDTLRAVRVESAAGEERLGIGAVILAAGGSARDLFVALHEVEVALEPRPTLMGVRIEHPQALIDRSQYGTACGSPALGHAEYLLALPASRRAGAGRPVHSFCMCPGGEVVPIASEAGGVSANGMSNYSRASGWANSALIAPIEVADYGSSDVLAGVAYQRRLERAVFMAGGGDYSLPAQAALDFHHGRSSRALPPAPRATRRRSADVHALVPACIAPSIQRALVQANHRIPGFLGPEATIYGLEVRTSSPVRITRHENGQSVSTQNLYPAGEGAGYAGGIMSAAIDGIERAERIISRFAQPRP